MASSTSDILPISSVEATQPLIHDAASRSDESMIVDTEQYRRTDHDRQGEVVEPSPAASVEDYNLATGKGKKREVDHGHQTDEGFSAGISAGAERPDDAMGPLYLVCKSRKLPNSNSSLNRSSAPFIMKQLVG